MWTSLKIFAKAQNDHNNAKKGVNVGSSNILMTTFYGMYLGIYWFAKQFLQKLLQSSFSNLKKK